MKVSNASNVLAEKTTENLCPYCLILVDSDLGIILTLKENSAVAKLRSLIHLSHLRSLLANRSLFSRCNLELHRLHHR
ncbi:hypothetical protein EYB25_003235 [Talaromyces marneffei]|nr:hypothetical protein EYB25_003235 [Talaromyces marneffei]